MPAVHGLRMELQLRDGQVRCPRREIDVDAELCLSCPACKGLSADGTKLACQSLAAAGLGAVYGGGLSWPLLPPA